MDALAATGEQVSAALTAIAIQAEGGKARSLLGHQVKILTDGAFTKARIKAIDGSKIFSTLDEGQIAVVAGFQGVDEQGNITTLGRGGSDTTRGRGRRGDRRGRVRDLHRRRRRLHDRPEHLPDGAQDRAHHLRRDARARVARREGAADPQRGDCDEVRRSGARAQLVHRRAGHLGHRRGQVARGRGRRRRRLRQERGARARSSASRTSPASSPSSSVASPRRTSRST